MRARLFVFGYREITVEKERVKDLLKLMLRLGITAEVSEDGTVVVGERDYKKLLKYSKNLSFVSAGRKGLPARIIKAVRVKGALIGAVLAILINLFASLFVWDVRVEGIENISEASLLLRLEEAGLSVGSLWYGIDKNRLEAAVLADNGDLAWLTVNRRGSVAYVKVIESSEHKELSDIYEAGNIVADRDCIIESISVERGSAAVKVGDVVRKGDLLISGITDTPGGTVIEQARGEVAGRAVRQLSMLVPRSETVYDTERGKIRSLSLKLFNFKLNIFKKYRNSEQRYDIIEAEKEFVLFGNRKLPISLQYSYPVFKEDRVVEYSETELVKIAESRMAGALYALFGESDIMGIKSHGEFTADGYSCYSEVTYVTEVGAFRALDLK